MIGVAKQVAKLSAAGRVARPPGAADRDVVVQRPVTQPLAARNPGVEIGEDVVEGLDPDRTGGPGPG